jgi:hypothetical protein
MLAGMWLLFRCAVRRTSIFQVGRSAARCCFAAQIRSVLRCPDAACRLVLHYVPVKLAYASAQRKWLATSPLAACQRGAEITTATEYLWLTGMLMAR